MKPTPTTEQLAALVKFKLPPDPRAMTVAEAELQVALDQIARLVSVLRRSDPEWRDAHGGEVVLDDEWDEVIEEAEEYLLEHSAATAGA